MTHDEAAIETARILAARLDERVARFSSADADDRKAMRDASAFLRLVVPRIVDHPHRTTRTAGADR